MMILIDFRKISDSIDSVREVADVTIGQAIKHARGHYQEGIIRGSYRISGRDLRGNACNYGASYARSRSAVLARCRKAGIVFGIAVGRNGRHILLWGQSWIEYEHCLGSPPAVLAAFAEILES